MAEPFDVRAMGVLRQMGLPGAANWLGMTRATNPMGEPTFGGEGFRKTNEPSPYDQTPEQRSRRAAEIAMGSGPGILTAVGRVRPVHQAPYDIAEARQMEMSGHHPQEIWDRLGVARGADRQWREEMPGIAADPEALDAVRRALLKAGNERVELPLGSVASKEFSQAYPELLTRRLTIESPNISTGERSSGSGGAWFNPSEGTLGLEPGARLNLPQLLEHETQHAVQNLHGWARGGTSDLTSSMGAPAFTNEERKRIARSLIQGGLLGERAWEYATTPELINYIRLAGEVEARNTERRMLSPSLRQQVPSRTEDVPRRLQDVVLPRSAVPPEDPYAGVWRSPLYESGRSLLSSSGNPNLIRDETTRLGRPFVTQEWKPDPDQLKQIRRVQKWLELIKPQGGK